jgi:murein DD-endopeptidase MepM/ murein hydrolase activator NlpD
MSKKFFSLILVPHCARKLKTITLSQKWLKALTAVSVFSVVLLVGFLVDYFTMSVTRAKYRVLLKENVDQKRLLSDYENSVKKLRDAVNNFESYVRKLNVMAGLRSPEVMEELGIGDGQPPPAEENGGGPDIPPADQGVTLQDVRSLEKRADEVGKDLDILRDHFEIQTAQFASKPTIWPTKGWVSSAFNFRDDPFTGQRAFHYGIDIATDYGNPIMATADGIVITLGNDKICGKNIVISHGNGITTHYLHMSKFLVASGQKVKRRDIIGLVGKSGKAMGPHLHYEVRINNKPTNPYNYILEE